MMLNACKCIAHELKCRAMLGSCRLMIGSGMLKAGEWDNEGWRELSAEGVVPIPAILQQIDPNHVEKVFASPMQ